MGANGDRQYGVHVPMGYSASTPVPAVFCIHGLDQNPVMFCLDTGVAWPTKADQEGFVVIMPNGYMNSWNGGTSLQGSAVSCRARRRLADAPPSSPRSAST